MIVAWGLFIFGVVFFILALIWAGSKKGTETIKNASMSMRIYYDFWFLFYLGLVLGSAQYIWG